MRKEKLELGHKELLYDRLNNVHVSVSEYSFANVYLFRNKHDYEVVFDEEIFIKGKTYSGDEFLMPTVDVLTIDISYLIHIMREADFLFPIPEEWLVELKKHKEFDCAFKRGDMDYIYTVEKMSTFPGRKLHKKRNLLKQFKELYAYEIHPLTDDRIDDAHSVLETWQEESGQHPDETDYAPCKEALDLAEELVMCGVLYSVEGEPAGFIMGEELNPEMFAIHFAKAKRKFKGIYQYMFNSFAQHLPAKYKYLNFEQDLGKKPLRIAKSSYVPDIMLKKCRVFLK